MFGYALPELNITVLLFLTHITILFYRIVNTLDKEYVFYSQVSFALGSVCVIVSIVHHLVFYFCCEVKVLWLCRPIRDRFVCLLVIYEFTP